MSTQLSTFVNTNGAVVLTLTIDDDSSQRAVALSPDAAAGLGQALIARSRKALEVRALFSSLETLLADLGTSADELEAEVARDVVAAQLDAPTEHVAEHVAEHLGDERP